MMSKVADAQKTLDQIHEEFTECLLCAEVYVTPKMLTCMHTFCLKCLERYGRGKPRCSKLPCPMCRTEFTIPLEGFSAFPTNFYISRLVELRQKLPMSPMGSLCEFCSERQTQGASNIARAVKYCVECKKPLCDECVKLHKIRPAFSNHTITLLSDKTNTDLSSGRPAPVMCHQHPKEIVNLYCKNCSVLVCVKCFCKQHNTHMCADVEDIAVESCRQISNELKMLDLNSTDFKEISLKQQSEIDSLMAKSASVKTTIDAQTDALKKIIDSCKSKIFGELDSFVNTSLSQMRNNKTAADGSFEAIDRLVQLATKVKDTGAHVDVIKFVDELKVKKRELKAVPDKNMVHCAQLTFTPVCNNHVVTSSAESLFGKLDTKFSPGEQRQQLTGTKHATALSTSATEKSLNIATSSNISSNCTKTQNSLPAVNSAASSLGGGGDRKLATPCSVQCARCGFLNHGSPQCRIDPNNRCGRCCQIGHTRKACQQLGAEALILCENCRCFHSQLASCSRQSGSDTNSDGVPCTRCGRTNHPLRECRYSETVVCCRCQRTGHLNTACPQNSGNDEEARIEVEDFCYYCQRWHSVAESDGCGLTYCPECDEVHRESEPCREEYCFNCGETHRLSEDCPASSSSSDGVVCARCGLGHRSNCTYPPSIRCYKCNQVGHHARICRL